MTTKDGTQTAERLLTVREVAQRLAISVRSVWKAASQERLPAPHRIGRSVRWRATDIDRFIASGCEVGSAACARGEGPRMS